MVINFLDRKVAKSDSIIDSRLFISLSLDLPLTINSLFLTNPHNRAHLGNQLLLYDKILIPTKDFGIIPILINWLGLKLFQEILESDALSFLHRKDLLGYAGNGLGISGFVISQGERKEWFWWQEALFGTVETAIEQQLKYMCPFINKTECMNLVGKVASKSKKIDYDNEFFMKNIVHETYTDIMNNKSFSLFVLESSKSGSDQIDLTRLDDMQPNQMRVLNTDRIRDSIDLVLRIAEVNLEVYMSTLFESADLFTSEGAELLLKDKLIRSGIGSTYLDGFLSLLELNNIPDIGKAIYSDSLSLQDIWEIREGDNSKEFRKWLRNATTKDTKEIVKLYIESLKNRALISSLPLKILRFAITSFVGAINPPVGLSVSAIDSFFVEKWLSGFSPRLFLDELSKIKIDIEK